MAWLRFTLVLSCNNGAEIDMLHPLVVLAADALATRYPIQAFAKPELFGDEKKQIIGVTPRSEKGLNDALI